MDDLTTSDTNARARWTLAATCAVVLCSAGARAQFSQQGDKLVGTGVLGAADQGGAVALSADGNTAIVGAAGDSGNIGAAYIYVRAGGIWSQQGEARRVRSGRAGVSGCSRGTFGRRGHGGRGR